MMVKTETLSNLSEIAKQLNAESDSLNDLIAHINKKLQAMNLGLEFYRTLKKGNVVRDGQSAESQEVEYLGFDKVEDQWQLVVKSETLEFRLDDNDERETIVASESWVPLSKESRALRLSAAEKLDEFLDQLMAHAKRKLNAVRSAKEKAGLK